jgi:hypothetical protein
MEPTAAAIIKQIQSLGYVVKVFTVDDTVEMQAVPLRKRHRCAVEVTSQGPLSAERS